MIRHAALVIAATVASPAAAETQMPAPPAAIAKHLKDGFPDPDDIGWMRGLFPGATEAQKTEWKAVQDWRNACFDAGTARVLAELTAMGQTTIASGESFPELLCAAVAGLTPPKDEALDWDAYLAANREAGKVFAIFFHGAKLGVESAPFDPAWANEEARTLMHATVRDQVYRKAMSWRVDGPALAPEIWPVLDRRLGLAVTREDGKNTAMLKTYVAKHGWPTISRVGERASGSAWLLVQHADRDPAFQLKALRLMEPMVAIGEVSKRNYAYLYDRVMLKLSGKQRYATQFHCVAGQQQARPLEDESNIERHRASMGLGTLGDYREDMRRAYGESCR